MKQAEITRRTEACQTRVNTADEQIKNYTALLDKAKARKATAEAELAGWQAMPAEDGPDPVTGAVTTTPGAEPSPEVADAKDSTPLVPADTD